MRIKRRLHAEDPRMCLLYRRLKGGRERKSEHLQMNQRAREKLPAIRPVEYCRMHVRAQAQLVLVYG